MTTHLIGTHHFTPALGHVIKPFSSMDERILASLNSNRILSVSIEGADAPKARQFYYGLLSKLVEGGVWAHKDAGDLELMVRAGRVAAMEIGNGVVRFTPVSKAGWSGLEWREYVNQAVHVVMTDIAPGILNAKLRAEIGRYCGVTFGEALEETA